MPIATWLRYLLGSRVAILQIAQHPHALWIGALFVLSAGLAREYDAEDLLHEPWHLLIPFAASLVTSSRKWNCSRQRIGLSKCFGSSDEPIEFESTRARPL